MKDNNKELTLEELDTVSGGDRASWRALDTIFNGAEMWRSFDDLEVSLAHRCYTAQKIKKLTGIAVDPAAALFSAKDVTFTMPDGTVLNEEQFLDYIKATYSMDEILAWKASED